MARFSLFVVAQSFASLAHAHGGESPGGVHHVPSEFATIQAAIDSAIDGDEVVVAPGTYAERITIPNRAITVRSSGGPDVTFLDGEQAGTVVTCANGAARETVLQGFTVRRGSTGAFGGGLLVDNAAPSVIDCVFESNEAVVGGGMAAVGTSNPLVMGCVFESNTATGDGEAGAAYIAGGGIHDCRFVGNAADDGGGAVVTDGVVGIYDSSFSDNTAGDRGGALYQAAGWIEMNNCDFERNDAATGGAIYTIEEASLFVANSWFCDNTPDHIWGKYFGIGNDFADECPKSIADVNNDGVVDFEDLLAVLAAWGHCRGCPEDVNEDGVIDFADILLVLSEWS